jgi:hypothetical protein
MSDDISDDVSDNTSKPWGQHTIRYKTSDKGNTLWRCKGVELIHSNASLYTAFLKARFRELCMLSRAVCFACRLNTPWRAKRDGKMVHLGAAEALDVTAVELADVRLDVAAEMRPVVREVAPLRPAPPKSTNNHK